jgi:hypothetical protein
VLEQETLEPPPIAVVMRSEFENSRKLPKAVAYDFVNRGDEPAWLLETSRNLKTA